MISVKIIAVHRNSREIIAPLFLKYNSINTFLTQYVRGLPSSFSPAVFFTEKRQEISGISCPFSPRPVPSGSLSLPRLSQRFLFPVHRTEPVHILRMYNRYTYSPVIERSVVQYPNSPVIGISASITCFPPATGVMPSTRPRLLFKSPHDISRIIVRNRYFYRSNGLQKNRRRFHKSFLERLDCRCLKCHLR